MALSYQRRGAKSQRRCATVNVGGARRKGDLFQNSAFKTLFLNAIRWAS
jgi:hypothetical protein